MFKRFNAQNLINLTFFLLFIFFFAHNSFAATYYVAPTGSDTTGNGSNPTPWATPRYACTQMAGGDTLILKNGTYVDTTPTQLGCDNQIRPPNGTAGNYTIVKAENDWQAIIDWSGCGSISDGDEPIRIYESGQTKQYIQVEGIKVINGTTAVYTRDCDHIKLKRLAIIASPASGTDDSGYGESFIIARNSHYVLLEDSWSSGCIRYGVLVIGDNGNSGGSDTTHVIVRRVVIRMDYKFPGQPKACFSAYGGNDSDCGSVDNIVFQNCIAIDWNPGSGMTDIYGGYYCPKFTKQVTFQGCIALNLKPGDGTCNGFYVLDNYRQNIGPTSMADCIAWDVKGMGIYWDRGGEAGVRSVTATADQCTIGALTAGERYAWDRDYQNGDWINSTLLNSIIDTSALNDTHIDTEKYNCYNIVAMPAGATNSITTDNGLLYLCRIETGSNCKGTGEGGKDIGANIFYKYGVDGTLWGEIDYATLTGTSLWPYPYEDQIRSDFRTVNAPKGAGTFPQTNDTTRGFCVNGTTLTKYIWEYLGNTIPAEIYVIAAPSILTASVVSISAINLSWADNSGIEEGFKLERKEGSLGIYSQIADLGQNVTSYSDTGLNSSTTYYYRVRAYSGSSNSLYSNEAFANTGTNSSGSTDSGGGGGGGGCFIATAVYGSYDASEVKILRKFRDSYLLKNEWGKKFVNWYYRWSPSVASVITDKMWIEVVIRAALKPTVLIIKKIVSS
ncbi:MAG: CFI-box-CTERM domain-containing protein [Candidatus Omnitrophota bacterium]|jgi:hypothetical protein